MNIVTLLFRFFAWFEMRSLEILADGQDRAIASTNDMSLYFEMIASRRKTGEELAAARAKYTATFKPGRRFTWLSA